MERTFYELSDQLAAQQHCVLHRLGQGAKEERSYYRFVWNKKTTEGQIQGAICKGSSQMLGQGHILSLSDTTDLDYSRRKGSIGLEQGLGYIGDHRGWGYNAHVHLNVRADSGSVVGLSDVHLWHRVEKKKARAHYHTPMEDKESYRWTQGCERSKAGLSGAAQVTFVQDREGDLYETFVKIPDERHHLLIRQRHNRRILTGEHKSMLVHQHLKECSLGGYFTLSIPKGHSRGEPRTARMEVRWSQVSILKNDKYAYEKAYPKAVSIGVVQVKEVASGVPAGEDPIEWCLWTTHSVETLQQALQIVRWYTFRWLIEEFFRILKKEGFELEKCELDSGYALRKMGLLTMSAAVRVLQLKQARDGGNDLPIEVVFDPQQQTCLSELNETLQGNTPALQNPHPEQSMAWACWIIARLGGWSGYASQRPPGVITLRNGLVRFDAIYFGWRLSRDALVYKR